MWTYSQASGELRRDGDLVAIGYSGNGEDKNNPADQAVKDKGPLPRGLYQIGQPVDSAHHGPFVLPLTADPSNEEFGRAGFLIHGDSITKPGCASEGCVILVRAAREKIAASGDRTLKVTA